MSKEPRVKLSIRIAVEILELVKRAAEATNRTMSSYVEFVLQGHFKDFLEKDEDD